MQNMSSSTRTSRVWSRSGCSTCKQRRKKCDEGKPGCGPCKRLQLHCDYQSVWRPPNTPSDKPRRRRRQPARSSSGPSSEAQGDAGIVKPSLAYDLNETSGTEQYDLDYDHGLLLYDAGVHESSELSTKENKNNDNYSWKYSKDDSGPLFLHSWTARIPVVGIEPTADMSHYLTYYVSHLSSWLVMVDATSNPLRETIIPRLSSSPMLLKAVCAVSACHLSQRQSDTSASSHGMAATKYYLQAMSDLNSTMSGTRQRLQQDCADVAILTAAFLCKYEIIRGSTREWRYHLAGLTRLMNELRTYATLGHAAKRFLKSFVTYHCEVAKVTSNDRLQHGDFNLPADDTTSGAEELDAYMGFTAGIVGLLGRTSKLLHVEDEHTAATESKSIYEALQSWKVDNLAYIIPSGVSLADVQNLGLTATAFHAAAFTYFYSVLALRAPSTSNPSSPGTNLNCFKAVRERLSNRKEETVIRCFEAIRQIPEGLPCESALVLPLFIMGCESDYPTQQAYAIERLRSLETNVGLGNIHRAREIVEYVQSAASSQNARTCNGPKWNRVTDSLGWDVIIT